MRIRAWIVVLQLLAALLCPILTYVHTDHNIETKATSAKHPDQGLVSQATLAVPKVEREISIVGIITAFRRGKLNVSQERGDCTSVPADHADC
jgi:hypothetical protein